MRGAVLKLGLLAAVTMLPAGAAEVNHSWETLAESVTVGKSVVVKRMNSIQVEGKLLAIGADSITVRWKKNSETISREDVFRVRYANINPENVPYLVEEHLVHGRVVREWAVGRLETRGI